MENGHNAGPRFASVPPNSNALWAILHPYIDITQARETRSVESHYYQQSAERRVRPRNEVGRAGGNDQDEEEGMAEQGEE